MNQNLKFLHSYLDGETCTTSFKSKKLEAKWLAFMPSVYTVLILNI